MSKASNINSLAALRERRREIASEQKAAKQGLTSTLAQAPAKAKDYALEDLALPALGIGLAFYVGYRLLRSRKTADHVTGQVPQQTAVAAGPPAPARTRAESRPLPTPPRNNAQPAKKSLLNLSTLMTAGKLLIPAAQAIFGVVQDQRTQQMAQAQPAPTAEPLEAAAVE
jgi:hypothetical protein